MDVDSVLRELEALGTERTKKSYIARGVREPLFGVATGAMKPLKKQIGVDQGLAEALWDSGNYDAMYFAGMIADVDAMTEADFERWVDGAYTTMLSDYVVAVTLAESDLAQHVAVSWIRSGDENRVSAGWACYEWLLGWRPDSYFEPNEIRGLLELVATTFAGASPRAQHAMRGFITAVGVSYAPLHQEALRVAEALGAPLAGGAKQIRQAAEKGKVGFKRRAVRC